MTTIQSQLSSCFPNCLSLSCIIDPSLDAAGRWAARIYSSELGNLIYIATAIASFVAGIFAAYSSGMWESIPFFACSGLAILCKHLLSENELNEARLVEVRTTSEDSIRSCQELRGALELNRERHEALILALQNSERVVNELRQGVAVATERSETLERQVTELNRQIRDLLAQRSALLEETRTLGQQLGQERERVENLNARLGARCAEAERVANLLENHHGLNENGQEIFDNNNATLERLIARKEAANTELTRIERRINEKTARLENLLLQAANAGIVDRVGHGA